MDENSKRKIYKTIGEKIKKIRKGKKSQQELADNLKITRTSVTNIEMGNQRVQIDTLWHIAELLGVSIHDLLPTQKEIGTVYELIPEDIDKDWIEAVKKVAKKHE
jgi:transcriptional regulator with XRE-family HTH domain